MKAISYCRVSSKAQQEKESIEIQKLELKELIGKYDYKVLGEFQDDGISGEEIAKRPGFKEALERIGKGDVDVLLVFMIDRIGRFKSRRDRNTVIELLEEQKTNVHSLYDLSLEDRLFRYDNEEAMNDLESELNASRRENVLRGIRIAKGHRNKRLKGRFSGGTVPYGIRWDKEIGKFLVDEKERQTLEEIFNCLLYTSPSPRDRS